MMGQGITLFRLGLAGARDVLALAVGLMFSIAAVHARLVDDKDIHWPDVGLGFLGVCAIFGYAGLLLYKQNRQSANEPETTEPTEITAHPDA